MHSLADRIRFARANAQLTQSELARQVGVSRASVSAWEQGIIKNLRGDHLNAVASATGRDVSFFIKDGVPDGADSLAAAAASERADGAGSRRTYSYVRLARYVEGLDASGQIRVIIDEADTMSIPRSWIGFKGNTSPNCAWLTMPGTAMADRIPSDAVIVIDCDAVIPQQGCVYAINDGDVLRVCYLTRLPHNRVQIGFHDPEAPAEQREFDEIAILGRAIWYSARL